MTGQVSSDASSFLYYFLSVFVSLGIVLVLAWISIRLLAGRLSSFGVKGRNIKVLETMPLGHRRSLHIVEVGGRVMLIGSSDGGISLLASIDRADLSPPGKEGESAGSRFIDLLRGKKERGVRR